MPRMTPEVQEEFMAEPHVGVIASLRRDGRPYTVPVWHHWDGSHVWISGTVSRIWCRQIKADARVSLCVEALAPVAGHVGIDGRAEVLEGPGFDIWPMSRRLAEKYIGGNDLANGVAVDAFVANMMTEPRLLIRLTPEVWRAIDMRVYRGKRADRQHQAQASSAPAPDL